MITLEGTWPGTAGGVVDTITLEHKVTYLSYRLQSAALSCCPREAYIRLVYETGSQNSNLAAIGSQSLHYRENEVGAGSNTVRVGVSVIEFLQRIAGCEGEPFKIKACITLVDTNCTLANITTKSCGSAASYVDVEGAA